MLANLDFNLTGSAEAGCELNMACGPRYNGFTPARRTPEEPGKFFQRAAWKSGLAVEDETEQWDGLA